MINNKEFDKQNEKKKLLDIKTKGRNHPKVGEVWWCSVGLNVGDEIYGKGENFGRPVLVINTESRSCFIGVPFTSKIKTGKYSKTIYCNEVIHTAQIMQVKLF